MAGQNELLIRINGDAKNASKAFDDVTKKTEDLTDSLNKASLIGAAAFAALSAEVFFSVQAFGESQAAANELTQALQTQGIFSVELRDQYNELSDAISRKTGIDDDQITKAQAVAQGYLGQTKITEELTQAIADLSTKYGGDLNSAAAAVAKTIGTGTNAFAREGLVIREGATEAERYGKVLEFVQGRYGGMAEASNKGLGSIRGLQTAFGNFQENIGERFAPIVEKVIKGLTNLLNKVNENEAFFDLAAAVIAGAAAFAGIIAVAGPLVTAFVTLKAAFAAAGIAAGVLQVGLIGLAGATGIGLLVGAVVYLALNWENSMLRIRQITTTVVTTVQEAFQGLFKIYEGLISRNKSVLDEGINQVKESASKGLEAGRQVYADGLAKIEAEQKASQEKQDANRKAFADKQTAEKQAEADKELAATRAANEAKILALAGASEEQIALKRQEAEILKQLQTEQDAGVIAALEARRQQILEMETTQFQEDQERAIEFDQMRKDLDAELQQQRVDANAQLKQKELAELQAQVQTEADVERKIQKDLIAEKIKARNQELEDRKKYGVAVATINAALNSNEIQSAKAVSGELIALTQSKNNTLKSIGKAAAVAQITIATAESAVTIAQKVIAALPFPINIPIAAGLAAARIAFGAEQIANVTGAADGALVSGAGRGDTQPFMLEPGELVAPRRNFNEVVDGVQTERSGVIDDIRTGLQTLLERPANNMQVTVEGDVLADEAYMDRFIEKLSDRLEFGNAKLFGVTA